MRRIYVAGPYTEGDRDIKDAVRKLIDVGLAPYAAELVGWDLDYPADLHKQWLFASDALVRLPGDCVTADQVVSWAVMASPPIKVYWSADECIQEGSYR